MHSYSKRSKSARPRSNSVREALAQRLEELEIAFEDAQIRHAGSTGETKANYAHIARQRWVECEWLRLEIGSLDFEFNSDDDSPRSPPRNEHRAEHRDGGASAQGSAARGGVDACGVDAYGVDAYGVDVDEYGLGFDVGDAATDSGYGYADDASQYARPDARDYALVAEALV
ncbi:hypothetical protein M885DRAFT_496730 [Pelagophyceae sp. CCMP2097]|nr:hypothetical protein M885DRAFT_496730 [Pelagophyceae sp. CCMP2097]